MAVNFFYHNPLDDNNGGTSHMMCEAKCEGVRTGPYSAKLKIWTRFVSLRGTGSYQFQYDLVIDNPNNNNGDDVHRTFTEAFSVAQEWNFYDEIDYDITPERTRINADFSAYRVISANNESGYSGIASSYIPAWITAPAVTDPIVSNVKPDRVSFSWEVTSTGGEAPSVYTDIYNYPGHANQWTNLNELGYGDISNGTVSGLNRYSSYGLRGHAKNTYGETFSNDVWFMTDPEKPRVGTISLTNNVPGSINYSFSVSDNGGKAIEKYALYILGGQYGMWTKISNSRTGTLSNLLHNTEYRIRGYATNDSSVQEIDPTDTKYTGFSETMFVSTGNGPVIDDFRAETINDDRIIITYSASYDLNAVNNTYLVRYKKDGDQSWSSLPEKTRVMLGLYSNQKYLVEITVIDSFNRSSSKQIYVFTESRISDVIVNKPIITKSGNNVTVTEDFSLPTNSSLHIKENMIFVTSEDGNDNNAICLAAFGTNCGDTVKSVTFDCTSNDTYLHPYKKYGFYCILTDNYGNISYSECQYFRINEEDSKIRKVNSDGTVETLSNGASIINSNRTVSKISSTDFVKLNSRMRYIMVGSSGLSSHYGGHLFEKQEVFGNLLRFKLKAFISPISNNIFAIKLQSLLVSSVDNNSHFLTNNSFEIKVSSETSNGTIISRITKIKNIGEISAQERDVFEFSTEEFFIKMENKREVRFDITCYKNNYFDTASCTETVVFPANDDVFDQLSGRFFDNSIVEIDVYSGQNVISLGKPVKMNQHNINAVSVNGGNATDGNHSDPTKYVRAIGADTLLLDLGQEQDIDTVKIWRRYSTNNGDNPFIYARNFIFGLNENKEICYKFQNVSSSVEETIAGNTYAVYK